MVSISFLGYVPADELGFWSERKLAYLEVTEEQLIDALFDIYSNCISTNMSLEEKVSCILDEIIVGKHLDYFLKDTGCNSIKELVNKVKDTLVAENKEVNKYTLMENVVEDLDWIVDIDEQNEYVIRYYFQDDVDWNDCED